MSVKSEDVIRLQLSRRAGICGHIHPLEQGLTCLYCRYVLTAVRDGERDKRIYERCVCDELSHPLVCVCTLRLIHLTNDPPRYIINGWLTRAYLVHHALVPFECATIMARNPFLVEMETLLRVNMLFSWLRGDFGPLDDFKITTADIIDVWTELLGVAFYPHGVMFPSRLRFYINKEKEFWDEVLTGDYRVFPTPPKKPKGRAILNY